MAVSQRVVAGVSIDECLSVGAYGAIHKAHTASRRDLRALVVDAKLSGESSFTSALMDDKVKAMLTSFDHPSIVPTLSIARQGEDVVVVTVGPGRHATVAELLGSGATRTKLPVEIAGAIAQQVVQALAAAHQRGLVHGAVHARSVAIDETGHVKLCDFAAGRALIEAVARGADPALLRGLTGSLPPEVALGDPPSAAGDVFAAGALLFTMLTGEPPPGALRMTPAVERVIQRALDTEPSRRFRDGTELLEALLESYDDDRWTLADAGELRKLVLGRTPPTRPTSEGNLDDDTEDLLASLGSAAKNSPLTRPSVDIRAAAAAERQKTGSGKHGLDALLADLDPKEELTAVDASPPRRDPISEIIRLDEGRRPPSSSPGRLESYEERADQTPLPAPSVGDDSGLMLAAAVLGKGKQRSGSPTVPAKPGRQSSPIAVQAPPGESSRPRKHDEIAALSAIADLDDRPPSEPAPAPPPARKPARVDSEGEDVVPARKPVAKPAAKPAPATVQRRPVSAIEPALDDAPPIRLKSRFWPIVWTLIILGGAGAAVWFFLDQRKQNQEAERIKEERELAAAKRSAQAEAELDDPGNVVINSEPNEGSVYMLLGRSTPVDYPPPSALVAFGLPTSQLLELRIELDSYTPIDTQVPGNLWSLDQGDDKLRVAKLSIPLKVAETDSKGRPKVVLDQQPAKPPDALANGPFPPGKGTVHVETTPPGAAVWLFLGTTNNVRFDNLVAGKDYEFRVLKNGYLPGYIKIAGEEWRKPGSDPKIPLSAAPKEETLTRSVTLVPDPKAPKPK